MKFYSHVYAILLANPLAYVASLLISWLSGSATLLLVMLIFVFIDLITGIWKAIKSEGWRSITSKGIRRTIEKLIGYSMIIVLGLIIDQTILNIEWISLIKIFTGLIVIAEFKSITENLTVITENKLFAKIYEIANNMFNKKINPDGNS